VPGRDAYLNYEYTRKGSPIKLAVPEEPGAYEIRYFLGVDNAIIARQAFTVTAVSATLSGPAQVAAGTKFKVSWTGPNNARDFITIVPAGTKERTYRDYEYTSKGSTLEFTPTRVSAKAGTRLRLRFVNEGTFPHNIAIPKSDDDIDSLAIAAYSAGETGYVPMGLKAKLVGWTTLASPGETVEVTFVVPAAGEYTYVCLFPGHANSMLGTLRALRP